MVFRVNWPCLVLNLAKSGFKLINLAELERALIERELVSLFSLMFIWSLFSCGFCVLVDLRLISVASFILTLWLFLVLFVESSSPSEDGEIDEEKPGLTVTRQPLRRADSDDEQLRHQLEEGEAL